MSGDLLVVVQLVVGCGVAVTVSGLGSDMYLWRTFLSPPASSLHNVPFLPSIIDIVFCCCLCPDREKRAFESFMRLRPYAY